MSMEGGSHYFYLLQKLNVLSFLKILFIKFIKNNHNKTHHTFNIL